MFRTLSIALVVTGLVVASPAAAQSERDPFDPLVEPATGGGAPGGDAAPDDAPFRPPQPIDELPVTGSSSPSDWLALAYAAVALGAGLVLIARINSPPQGAPRRRSRAGRGA